MKKILLGAVSVLGMVSCSENEVLNQVQQAISFDKAQFGNSILTKGTTDLAGDVALGVYCYNSSNLYFDHLRLSKNGESWLLATTQYWPSAATTLDFWAYGPYKDELKSIVSHEAGKMTISGYIADGIEDLIITKEATKASKGDGLAEPDRISLTLSHSLSQIIFNAKLADSTPTGYYVDNVEITIAANNTGTFETPNVWTASNLTSYTRTYGKMVKTEDEFTAVHVVPNANLIPQDVTITATANAYTAAGALVGTLSTSAGLNLTIEQGYQYTYTLTMNPANAGTPIIFSNPQVTDWTTGSSVSGSN